MPRRDTLPALICRFMPTEALPIVTRTFTKAGQVYNARTPSDALLCVFKDWLAWHEPAPEDNQK